MGLKRGIMLELDDGVYTISFPYVPLGGLWGGQEVKNSVRKAEIFFKVTQENEASTWAVLIIIGGIEKKVLKNFLYQVRRVCSFASLTIKLTFFENDQIFSTKL